MAIYKYNDVDGDRLAIFPALIPGVGPGVNIRTDPQGCSIPEGEIPGLIKALQDYAWAGPGSSPLGQELREVSYEADLYGNTHSGHADPELGSARGYLVAQGS
jgi:hypothetical protein